MEVSVWLGSVDLLPHLRCIVGQKVTTGTRVNLLRYVRAEVYLVVSKMVSLMRFASKRMEMWTLKLSVVPVRCCLLHRRC